MARLKNTEGNFKRKDRTNLPENVRTNRRETRTSVMDREDLDESEEYDEELESEIENDFENEYEREDLSDEDLEEEELDEEEEDEDIMAEDEEHISGRSVTRNRHNDRNEVSRVGRIKSQTREFSANGHGRNKKVDYREETGANRLTRRNEITARRNEPAKEQGRVSRTTQMRTKAGVIQTAPLSRRNERAAAKSSERNAPARSNEIKGRVKSTTTSNRRNEQPSAKNTPAKIQTRNTEIKGRTTQKTPTGAKPKSNTPTSRRRER